MGVADHDEERDAAAEDEVGSRRTGKGARGTGGGGSTEDMVETVRQVLVERERRMSGTGVRMFGCTYVSQYNLGRLREFRGSCVS